MRSRHLGWLTLIVGVLLFFTPLYWDTLLAIGAAPVLDPAAAIGAAPGGGYPAAVGSAALAVGSAVIWLAENDDQPTMTVLAGAIGGAVIGIFATTVFVSAPWLLATQIGLAGTASGFAAVRGVAVEQSIQRLGMGLVVLSLAPFAGAHILRGATVGGLAGFASFLLAGSLIVYTAILSYPFYRLGRTVQ